MSETRLNTPFGVMTLLRLPRRKRELLRAWDAADEYLLKRFEALNLPLGDMSILIVNDSFGALSVALSAFQPINWSDSWLAHQACKENLSRNDLGQDSVHYLSSLEGPSNRIDLVFIKVPKTLALLEHQLILLKPQLSHHSLVIVAGMVKNLPSSVWTLLERIIGPCQTLRAYKKARLIESKPDFNVELPVNPYPVSWQLPGHQLVLLNHANVFSREKLDIGTRFFIEHLPQSDGELDIVDLGCGNGVLGLLAAEHNSQARLHFVDESYMALASARENLKQIGNAEERCRFYTADGLKDFSAHSMDLVLCNPPFHQVHSMGDMIAKDMFRHAARILRPEGALWIVGNRHLGYHKKLQCWFNEVRLVTSNAKFVVVKASSPRQ